MSAMDDRQGNDKDINVASNPGHFERENYTNLFLNFGLLIFLLPIIFLIPNVRRFPGFFGITALSLGLGGFIFFSIAKFSLFSRGKFLSFGSGGMTQRNRMFYRLGYALIVSASMIAISILFVEKIHGSG